APSVVGPALRLAGAAAELFRSAAEGADVVIPEEALRVARTPGVPPHARRGRSREIAVVAQAPRGLRRGLLVDGELGTGEVEAEQPSAPVRGGQHARLPCGAVPGLLAVVASPGRPLDCDGLRRPSGLDE